MSETLLPCPFCGGDDVWSFCGFRGFIAECQGCAARGPHRGSHEDARAAWNRRAPAEPPSSSARELSDEQIAELAYAHGFNQKLQPDGAMALNPYVFHFARALIRCAFAQSASAGDAEMARDAVLVSASESMIGFVDSVFEYTEMNETRKRFAHYVGKLRAAIAASKGAA